MLNPEIQTSTKLSRLRRFLADLILANTETLARCSEHNGKVVSRLAELMLLTAFYQFALFTAIGIKLFCEPGQFNPLIPVVAGFIAIFILKIDAFSIVQTSFHAAGVEILKRGGIDLSGGWMGRAKGTILFAVRGLLALCLAQLTAIFASILIFTADIGAYLKSDNTHANVAVVAAATERIDGDIRRQHDAITAEKDAIDKAVAETSALRKREDDLATSEPRLQEAQAEIAHLGAVKARADEELQEAETFALNEAAGIKGSSSNSGQIGEGVRYRAASERVANAKAHAAAIASALDAARGRADDLTKRFNARTEAMRQDLEKQLSGTEKAIADGKDRLAALNDQLTRTKTGRDEAIRAAVKQAPDYVPERNGLLSQIAALRSIADSSPEVAIVILLIEVTSLGFELAAVLAVTSFAPSTYAALVVRDGWMHAVTIVDEMTHELDRRAGRPQGLDFQFAIGLEPANDNESASDAPSTPTAFEGIGDEPPPPQPPKRPRGRPRKNPAA